MTTVNCLLGDITWQRQRRQQTVSAHAKHVVDGEKCCLVHTCSLAAGLGYLRKQKKKATQVSQHASTAYTDTRRRNVIKYILYYQYLCEILYSRDQFWESAIVVDHCRTIAVVIRFYRSFFMCDVRCLRKSPCGRVFGRVYRNHAPGILGGCTEFTEFTEASGTGINSVPILTGVLSTVVRSNRTLPKNLATLFLFFQGSNRITFSVSCFLFIRAGLAQRIRLSVFDRVFPAKSCEIRHETLYLYWASSVCAQRTHLRVHLVFVLMRWTA